MKPYYQDDAVTIYHGDCREVLPLITYDAIVTDPPYPNSTGHFQSDLKAAEEVLPTFTTNSLVFWSEICHPPVRLPLVAVHISIRSNVNGKLYEPIYHFAPDGRKRRSGVWSYAAIFAGATGCVEYAGHPTQKPSSLMIRLLGLVNGVVLDPFCGSGSTLVASKRIERSAIGIEIEERYCEIAAKRCQQEVLALGTVA